jgi:sn-glycerol 3-phosphate transport system substrate-binding protein
MTRSLCASLAGAFTLLASAAQGAVELQLWHSMDGALGEQFAAVVDRFNNAQATYKIVPTYKGSYDETIAAGMDALRARKAPHVLQVYDVGIAHMIAARTAVKPLHQLMRDAGERFDASAFLPAVASSYADSKGNLITLPFNASTPVLYVNDEVLKSAGVEAPLFKTWYQLQEALLEVREKKTAPCGLTTTAPAWVMLENLMAWHNEAFASRKNGYDGLDAELIFNTRLAIRHISLMTSWQKARIFSYFGRRDEGEMRFARGECAALTASSASYASLVRQAKFRFRVLPLPHYDDMNDAPHTTLLGGASLWAMAGKSAPEHKGVAKFFAFLITPQVQTEWHQKTGYVPITRAAYELTRQSGFYDEHPGADVGLQQLVRGGTPKVYARGIRLGNHLLIRAAVEDELEQAWALVKAPKQALDDAVKRGNELLRRFERAQR